MGERAHPEDSGGAYKQLQRQAGRRSEIRGAEECGLSHNEDVGDHKRGRAETGEAEGTVPGGEVLPTLVPGHDGGCQNDTHHQADTDMVEQIGEPNSGADSAERAREGWKRSQNSFNKRFKLPLVRALCRDNLI